MPSTHFDDFGGGMDQRSRQNTSKGKAFWLLNNCNPTTGRKLKKRPAWAAQVAARFVGNGPVGLATNGDELYTFSRNGDPVSWPAVPGYSGDPGTITATNIELDGHAATLARVYFARLFAGFFFVIAEDTNSVIKCHYIDGAATNISDVNAPTMGKAAVLAEQKVWVPDGDKVRYCATGDPRDWTTGGDAGFIPVAQNSPGSDVCSSVGLYQGNLVVFMLDNIQIYAIDPDPANITLLKVIDGVGSDFPGGNAPVSADLFFNTTGGTRSLSTLELTDNVADVDVGSPVAGPMGTDIGANESDTIDEEGAVAYWFQGLGQYWVASSTYLWVYTFSRTSKISAWARYSLEGLNNPAIGWSLAERRGTVFYNDGTGLYMFDRTKFVDQIFVTYYDQIPSSYFGGSTYIVDPTSAWTGAANTDTMTLCIWFQTANTASQYILDGTELRVWMSATGVVTVDLTYSTGTPITITTTAGWNDQKAHFLMVSRHSNTTLECTIDGEDVIATVGTNFAGDLRWSTYDQRNIGARVDTTLKFNGEIGYIWLSITAALHPSVAANLDAFFPGGNPGTIASDGTITISDTDYRPIMYRAAPNLENNAGSGGVNGTITGGSLIVGSLTNIVIEDSPIMVEAMQNFDAFKKPGQRKMVFGGDVVCKGQPTIEVLYDPDDTTLRTDAFETSGDSRRDGLLPIECNATEIAFRFTHARDEDFELDLFGAYYDNEALT